MTWDRLTVEEANAIVTNYGICYKESDTSDHICKANKANISKDKNTFILDGLNKSRYYDVAVRAATVDGFGPVGMSMRAKTKEDRELFKFNFFIILHERLT